MVGPNEKPIPPLVIAPMCFLLCSQVLERALQFTYCIGHVGRLGSWRRRRSFERGNQIVAGFEFQAQIWLNMHAVGRCPPQKMIACCSACTTSNAGVMKQNLRCAILFFVGLIAWIPGGCVKNHVAESVLKKMPIGRC